MIELKIKTMVLLESGIGRYSYFFKYLRNGKIELVAYRARKEFNHSCRKTVDAIRGQKWDTFLVFRIF